MDEIIKSDVVVPAAGIGKRMGAALPKQYLDLCGKTILERSVNTLLGCPAVNRVIIAIAPDDPYFKDCSFSEPSRILTVEGGKERCDSVRKGLDTVNTEWVMVHDAARPLVQSEDILSLAKTCIAQHCGGILASPVADTLKRSLLQGSRLDTTSTYVSVSSPKPTVTNAFSDNSVTLAIESTVDRSSLFRAQTPQMFKTQELKDALDKAEENGLKVTDEASALELQGQHPLLVLGSANNFKVTEPADLELARALIAIKDTACLSQDKGSSLRTRQYTAFNADSKSLNKGCHMQFRIGHGFDVHRFGGEGPCTLGGVKVPYEQGLIAHSDGDVVLHALCDALLGALALGDIGKLYPDNDDAFLNVDSRKLLRDVYKRVQDKGYCLVNADITILAQVPKIAPHSAKMQENIATDLKVDTDQVSIKATTTEKLGFTGRKEGIAVEAVALLEKIKDLS